MNDKKQTNRFINSSLAYALGAFALIVPGQAFQAFYSYFYVDKLGMAIGLFTLGRTIFTIWDAVNDPLAGMLSDRTRTRLGRRKPWLLIAAIPFSIAFFLVFAIPQGIKQNQTSLFVWFFVFLVVYETFSSIGWVNYNALLPELFLSVRKRANASAVSQAFLIGGVAVATIGGPILYDKFGYATMAGAFAILFLAVLIPFTFSFKENSDFQKEKPLSFKGAYLTTLKNRELWTFYIPNALVTAVETTLSAQIPFYAKYCLKLPDHQVALLMGAIFISIIPFVPIWSAIIKKIGAKNAWKVSFGVFALAVIPLYFAHNLIGGIAAGIAAGFGLSGWRVTPPVLNAEIIDRDALRCGQRREAMYGSIGGFLQRLSNLFLTFAFLLTSVFYGYQSGENPGSNPDAAFRFLMSVLPFILLLGAFLLTFLFKEAPVHQNISQSAYNTENNADKTVQ